MYSPFGIDPIILLAYIITFLVAICFLYGGVTDNVSQVDRLWSILPVCVSWIYVYVSEFSYTVILMTLCVTLWGVRLTTNYYIKGGYEMKNGIFVDEDYRWPVVHRGIPNPVLWDIFHLGFICIFQLVEIVGFTSPILLVAMSDDPIKALSKMDICFIIAFLFFLLGETLADYYMYEYQTAKYQLAPEEREKSTDLRIVAGFNFTGFCKFSRHPNYFCEVMQWVVVYLWGSWHLQTWKNWGLIFIIILFVIVFSSTFVNETISNSKYPLFKEYQRVTSRFFPFFPIHYKRFVDMVKAKQE